MRPGVAERQAGVVLGLDDRAAAGTGAGLIARFPGRRVFLSEGEQAPFEFFEGLLADALHQRRQRQAGGPQQAPQVALGNGRELLPQLLPLGFTYAGWPRLGQVAA